MRKRFDNIEIKEPPIRELNKKRSCARRTCCTGFFFIILIVIVALLFLRFVTTPREKEIKVIPRTFPKSMPLYNIDDIEKITYISGDSKRRGFEMATFLPKKLVGALNTENSTALFYLDEVLTTTVEDQRDTIHIEWIMLSASPSFIADYYKTGFRKAGYEIDTTIGTDTIRQYIFKKDDIEGVLLIQDDPETLQTDYISIITNYHKE